MPLQDAPLTVKIESRQLVIRIGVATLAFANEYSPDEMLSRYRITNPLQFAKDVAAAMRAEEEDGSTPLTDFLDKMMEEAIEDGSIWAEEKRPALEW